jgi:hypothetical protein
MGCGKQNPRVKPSACRHNPRAVPRLDSPESSLYNPPALLCPAIGEAGAQVAQLVEHAIENRSVGGSIPPLGTTTFLSN